MKPAPFEYRRAESVEHALELLAAGDARVLAGGQSLVPLMNMRRVRPAVVVDITRVAGLAAAGEEVGALVTQADFEAYAGRCPAVAECLPFTGHLATRNRGTVGGSIAHADPRGELPLVLLTLGGTATVASRRGRRTIAAEDLFAGAYRTTLAPDELLLSTTWPTTRAQAFEEVAQRHGDYTLAAAACALDGSGARIGVAAVADRPRLCRAAAAALADGDSPEDAAPHRRRRDRAGGGPARERRLPAPSDRRPGRARGEARMVTIDLTVNGRRYREAVEPRLLLSDFLRHTLGLTGTHVGCEHGVCGACTVHVDGRATRSCLVFAVQADGCEVQTVEGLAGTGELTDLQQAFRRHGALQCGFCTPGVLMAAEDLLSHGRDVTREDIERLLAGQVCRCTGYEPIVDAIAEVAAQR